MQIARLTALSLCLSALACAGGTRAPSVAPPFDPLEAERVLSRLDMKHCYNLPPLEDSVSVIVTFVPSGDGSSAAAESVLPLHGWTPASECVASVIRALRIPSSRGETIRVLATYEHAADRGVQGAFPFDENSVRTQVAAVSLYECARIPGPRSGRVTLTLSPSGGVNNVTVSEVWRHQRIINTSLGDCVARKIGKGVKVPPHAGLRRTLDVDVAVPPEADRQPD